MTSAELISQAVLSSPCP